VLNSKYATIQDKNFSQNLLNNIPENLYNISINDLLLNLDSDYFDN
jgi:hypothetical protein